MPVSSADSRVADWAVEARDIWDRTQDAIWASKERMRSSADAHRCSVLTFAPGDLVWLSSRNIRLRVESTNFAPRYFSPFKVLDQVNPVVYRLALPPRLGITDTLHVSLLKPVYMSRFSESSSGTSDSSTEDYERFFRNLRLKAHFQGIPDSVASQNDSAPLQLSKLGLRIPSTFMPPKNYPPIETFISLVEKDIETFNREVHLGKFHHQTNLTQQEKLALNKLSTDKTLTIKPADKGGAIVVMDSTYYMSEILRQLNDTQVYESIPHNPTNSIASKIKYIKNLHKPPGRPIVSSTDSILSPLAITLERILTPLTKQTKSFLLDTNEFLGLIKSLGPLSTSTILVTWDVCSLYTSITHTKGMEATDRLLTEAKVEPKVRRFCADILSLVLRENFFLFQDTFYVQRQGTAMGSNVAPPYAVAYMAAFEEDFIFNHSLFQQHSRIWRRFIDDIFCIWEGPLESLLLFDSHINNIWPELKFTLQYSVDNISFLDTRVCKNTDGRLSIDLHTKPTDRNSLLQYTSFLPTAIKKSIPISQFQRVKRIVTDNDIRNQRLNEMEEKFSNRGYPKSLLAQAKHSSPKPKNSVPRIPFVNTYHPFSRRVQASIHRHWNILSKSYPRVPEFQQPFLSCYRRPTNIKDKLARADVGSDVRVPRQTFLRTQKQGTFPCLNCLQCNNVQKGDKVFHPHTGKGIPIRGFFTCDSSYVIYIIKCPCGLAYVGETTQAIRDRVSQHKSNIRCNRDHLPLPHHFRTTGHSVAQLRYQVLEHVDQGRRGQSRTRLLKKREAYWIFTLQTLEPKGLNRDFDTSSFL
ncbi:unnamed protein product [Ranitomeya imitator]|uniref:Reverse transcriptase domain-containing protein n=1 Tax=Ranitomeya imitator TaxID=111125 RepID=A0ABN9L1R9_9NEOB|nr:unnamed protein product [Ranitomeya imitator]